MISRFSANVPIPPPLPAHARPVTWQEVQLQKLNKIPEASKTAVSALMNYKASDHQLADMNDAARTLTVATIAGLGSMEMTQPTASLPLWLGAGSWLGAMALTPKIINGMVYLKTGVNLNTQYLSSTGVIRPLFQDPGYMPLQVLPPQTHQALMRRLGIPLDSPDRNSLLEAKLKQIAVQTHTWWMLMAGISTPVLASVICDRIENPAKDLLSRLRYVFAKTFILAPAQRSGDPQKAALALEKTFHNTIGSGSDSTLLARWWKRFPDKMLKVLHLHEIVDGHFLQCSEQERTEKLVQYLYEQIGKPGSKTRQNFLDTLTALERGSGQALDKIFQPLEEALRKAEATLPSEAKIKLEYELELQKASAKATVNHLRELAQLFISQESAQNPLSPQALMDSLKERIEKPVLPYIEQLMREGRVSKAVDLMGNESSLNKVMQYFNASRFKLAFLQMGASPQEFFLQALNSAALRRRWVLGYPLLLGGLMAASTALFVTFFVGRNFKSSSNEGP